MHEYAPAMNANDSYRRILGLRAVRAFREEQLSEADLDAILEVARWTGSSKNNQNWKFIVIQDPDQKERLTAAGTYMTPVANAPCVIVLADLSEGYEFDVGRAALDHAPTPTTGHVGKATITNGQIVNFGTVPATGWPRAIAHLGLPQSRTHG